MRATTINNSTSNSDPSLQALGANPELPALARSSTSSSFFLLQYSTLRLPSAKVMAYSYLTPAWVMLWEIGFGSVLPPAPVLLGIGACMLTQLQKNAYESALVVPLLILMIILVVGSDQRRIRGLERLSVLIVIIAAAGQVFLIPYLTPRLVRSQAQAGVIDTQKHSIPVFSYAAIDQRVRAAARQCRIPLDGSARYVGIDDLSYLVFADSWRPMYRFGMNGAWSYNVPDPVGLLRERRSSGMVVQCRELKPELRAHATVVGDFCCLGAH